MPAAFDNVRPSACIAPDLPVWLIFRNRVKLCPGKDISLYQKRNLAAHTEGRFAVVTKRGAGGDGRWRARLKRGTFFATFFLACLAAMELEGPNCQYRRQPG
jgi:hypothetical protein